MRLPAFGLSNEFDLNTALFFLKNHYFSLVSQRQRINMDIKDVFLFFYKIILFNILKYRI